MPVPAPHRTEAHGLPGHVGTYLRECYHIMAVFRSGLDAEILEEELETSHLCVCVCVCVCVSESSSQGGVLWLSRSLLYPQQQAHTGAQSRRLAEVNGEDTALLDICCCSHPPLPPLRGNLKPWSRTRLWESGSCFLVIIPQGCEGMF